jgi:hypothetical protein
VLVVPIKRALALLLTPLFAVGMSACASTASLTGFKGEEHSVAQTISNLQSDATAGEAKKICAEELSAAITARLNTVPGGCTLAVKNQLAEVDTPELTIRSVQVSGTSASAQVKSTYAGRSRISKLSLVKEGGKWKISRLG